MHRRFRVSPRSSFEKVRRGVNAKAHHPQLIDESRFATFGTMPDCSPEQVRQSLEVLYRSDSGRILATLVRLLERSRKDWNKVDGRDDPRADYRSRFVWVCRFWPHDGRQLDATLAQRIPAACRLRRRTNPNTWPTDMPCCDSRGRVGAGEGADFAQ
jgi:hypothetical protein